MPLLLAIETSTTVCSIALFNGPRLLGASELQIEKSHSSHITVMVAQLVENCGLTLQDLEAVAISGGPGSYTGLRIGSATAKGLCYSLNIPLLEVSTLHGLAAQVVGLTPKASRFLFCPMLDARRMEVYLCLVDSNLKEVEPVVPVVLDAQTLEDRLSEQQVVFFGNGAQKFKELVAENENALFIDNVVPSAITIGQLALQKFEQKAFEDVAYYEPFYLKDVYITKAGKSAK